MKTKVSQKITKKGAERYKQNLSFYTEVIQWCVPQLFDGMVDVCFDKWLFVGEPRRRFGIFWCRHFQVLKFAQN